MSQTGFRGFDRTLHETHQWLGVIGEVMNDTRSSVTYHALRGTLRALRDRLPVEEVFDLSAQLPMLIRGIYFEGYRPGNKPEKMDREAFLERVRDELDAAGGANPELAIRGVFTAVNRKVAVGEVLQVRNALPSDLRTLWPDPEVTEASG